MTVLPFAPVNATAASRAAATAAAVAAAAHAATQSALSSASAPAHAPHPHPYHIGSVAGTLAGATTRDADVVMAMATATATPAPHSSRASHTSARVPVSSSAVFASAHHPAPIVGSVTAMAAVAAPMLIVAAPMLIGQTAAPMQLSTPVALPSTPVAAPTPMTTMTVPVPIQSAHLNAPSKTNALPHVRGQYGWPVAASDVMSTPKPTAMATATASVPSQLHAPSQSSATTHVPARPAPIDVKIFVPAGAPSLFASAPVPVSASAPASVPASAKAVTVTAVEESKEVKDANAKALRRAIGRMPQDPRTVPDFDVLPVLACVLNQLCRTNDRSFEADAALSGVNGRPKQQLTKFHALSRPNIGVEDYLNRIRQYAECSSECFILALIYIDRLIKRFPNRLTVNSYTIHRLLITSVMLASKYFDDVFFSNAYFAAMGGVENKELNALEVEFSFALQFQFYVAPDTYALYHNEIANHHKLHVTNGGTAQCLGLAPNPKTPVAPAPAPATATAAPVTPTARMPAPAPKTPTATVSVKVTSNSPSMCPRAPRAVSAMTAALLGPRPSPSPPSTSTCVSSSSSSSMSVPMPAATSCVPTKAHAVHGAHGPHSGAVVSQTITTTTTHTVVSYL